MPQTCADSGDDTLFDVDAVFNRLRQKADETAAILAKIQALDISLPPRTDLAAAGESAEQGCESKAASAHPTASPAQRSDVSSPAPTCGPMDRADEPYTPSARQAPDIPISVASIKRVFEQQEAIRMARQQAITPRPQKAPSDRASLASVTSRSSPTASKAASAATSPAVSSARISTTPSAEASNLVLRQQLADKTQKAAHPEAELLQLRTQFGQAIEALKTYKEIDAQRQEAVASAEQTFKQQLVNEVYQNQLLRQQLKEQAGELDTVNRMLAVAEKVGCQTRHCSCTADAPHPFDCLQLQAVITKLIVVLA
jgi:hypothetical protein